MGWFKLSAITVISEHKIKKEEGERKERGREREREGERGREREREGERGR